MELRKWALIVAMLGIAVLIVFLFRPYTEELVDLQNLESAELNTKVLLRGSVDSEVRFDDFRILEVDGIEIICECEGVENLEKKEIRVVGLVDEYEGDRQIRVLELEIL